MGGTIVLPETDTNITKVIKNFKFEPKDISHFWKIFQKLDAAKTGLVPLTVIFKKIEMDRNLLTDCLLELLQIEHDGEINFSDFLLMVTQYCFFETSEILKFCFYVFDQDKTGFFSIDDLNNLINAVHNIKSGSTIRGTVKASWNRLTFSGEELNYAEFKQIHAQFPRLFQPAFQMQQQMMIHFMGEYWWIRKKDKLELLREEADRKIKAKEKRKRKKKDNKRARKTQRNMGFIRYYLCPCLRKHYDPTLSEYDKMSAAEKAARDKELALARRQAELKVKNPETAAWLKYQKKVAKETHVITTIDEDGDSVIEGSSVIEAAATGGGGSSSSAVMNMGAMSINGGGSVSISAISVPESQQTNTIADKSTPSNGGGRNSISNGSERSSIQSNDGAGGSAERSSIQSIDGTQNKSSSHPQTATGTVAMASNHKQQQQPQQYQFSSVSSITNASTLHSRTKTVVVNNYLDRKFTGIERNRASRAESRAERKQQRQHDPELKHQPRATLSGIDT